MLNSDDMKKLEVCVDLPDQTPDEVRHNVLWLVQKVRDLHKEWQLAAQANYQLRQALKVVL